jgi:hypothetical protein
MDLTAKFPLRPANYLQVFLWMVNLPHYFYDQPVTKKERKRGQSVQVE